MLGRGTLTKWGPMNYSPGTAIGFYASIANDPMNVNVLTVCRPCFSSDSELFAEEPIYNYEPHTVAMSCDYCGEAL